MNFQIFNKLRVLILALLITTALIVSFPITAIGNDGTEYRWYRDSLDRWCLQHSEKDLCLPRSMLATEFRPDSPRFELPDSEVTSKILVSTILTINETFNESQIDDLPLELVDKRKVNGIEMMEFRYEQITVIRLRLSADLTLEMMGYDADRISRWISNLSAQWHVNMRTYSKTGHCANVFTTSCVTESPVALKLVEEIDKL